VEMQWDDNAVDSKLFFLELTLKNHIGSCVCVCVYTVEIFSYQVSYFPNPRKLYTYIIGHWCSFIRTSAL
jgi:hypothetical protein